jgi:hypothetical protein
MVADGHYTLSAAKWRCAIAKPGHVVYGGVFAGPTPFRDTLNLNFTRRPSRAIR